MQDLPLRLVPGDDLRGALERAVRDSGCTAAFVVCGIGSLGRVELRLAGAEKTIQLDGDHEILTLAGSIAATGSHLHMAVSDREGRVLGGHVGPGCIVRTTAEVLVALLPGHHFSREADEATGYAELKVLSRP